MIRGLTPRTFTFPGNDSIPIGSFYDAEMVFAGEGNLGATNFTQMDSTLGLFYLNFSSNQLSAFPTYYSFRGDTGEATYDLHVQYSENGDARVMVGSLISTSVQLSSSSSPSQASNSTSSQTSSGTGNISDSYVLVAIPVVVIMILLGVSMLRRKRSGSS